MSWNIEADYNVMQPITRLLKEVCQLKPGEHVTIIGDTATDTETIRPFQALRVYLVGLSRSSYIRILGGILKTHSLCRL